MEDHGAGMVDERERIHGVDCTVIDLEIYVRFVVDTAYYFG